MKKPLGIQLYTLRNEIQNNDPRAILQALHDFNYEGVETAGLYGMKPAEFKALVDQYGLKITSIHGPVPTSENVDELKELVQVFETPYVFTSTPKDEFLSPGGPARFAERVKEAHQAILGTDIVFGIHNHWWEFVADDQGRFAIDAVIDETDVKLQLDLYWASNFGKNDVPAIVRKYRERIVSLHVKDGPLVEGEPMTAVGEGKMDIPACLAEIRPEIARWYVIELDECGTDMIEAVRKSALYMRNQALS